MKSTILTFAGIQYRTKGLHHRRHSCTIQRVEIVEDRDICYLIIRDGKLMGRAWTGRGAMVMASAYNPHA